MLDRMEERQALAAATKAWRDAETSLRELIESSGNVALDHEDNPLLCSVSGLAIFKDDEVFGDIDEGDVLILKGVVSVKPEYVAP